MKLSVKTWSPHARIPACTMLIIAKSTGLRLLINNRFLQHNSFPMGDVWAHWPHATPKVPKAGLRRCRPGWAVGSWSWL